MFGKKRLVVADKFAAYKEISDSDKRDSGKRLLTEIASAMLDVIVFCQLIFVAAIYYYSLELPDYKQLEVYEPKMMTRLYAGDGRLLGEYAKEKRIFVPISAIPKRLQQAFISAEDKNFYTHQGIDFQGITRAIFTNIKNVGSERGLVGGSTITQQVVKNFLLSSEKKYERKIKEAILAIRISQVFPKQKVMELYLNEIYLGASSYGVAVASINYFNKSIDDLEIEEMAMLAALPKAPSSYDPKRHPKAAKQRRNWVIEKMAEQRYISRADAEIAKQKPIKIVKRNEDRIVHSPVFAEEVRRKLIKLYGEDKVYKGGLTVHTTVNAKMQNFAEKALLDGISTYDKRHGYKGAIRRALTFASWQEQLLRIKIQGQPTEWKKAVVMSLTKNTARIGTEEGKKGEITLKSSEWAKPRRLVDQWERIQKENNYNVDRKTRREWEAKLKIKGIEDVFSVGDIVLVSKAGEEGLTELPAYNLEQIPDADGAIVVMDPHTGRVLAMVGGLMFRNPSFNRATQAKRQPGSAFKTFVYLTALEEGLPPNMVLLDEPIVLRRNDTGLPWRPQNYSGEFYGPTPIRKGLEKSRNVLTIQLARRVGLRAIDRVAKKFGVYDGLPINDYSAVLGSAETTLIKLTNAYSMIVNGGKKNHPAIIETVQDKNGKIIYRRDKRNCHGCTFNNAFEIRNAKYPPIIDDNREQIVTKESAYQISSMLRGAVLRGTGVRAARQLKGHVVAGKTGTTNSSVDAWFVGFTPDLVCGVFIGKDQPRTLGNRETGSNVALPVFINFMKKALEDKPSIPFRVPEGISLVNIDAETGLLPSRDTVRTIEEAFKVGAEPTEESDSDTWKIRYKGKIRNRNEIERIIRDDNSPVGTGSIY